MKIKKEHVEENLKEQKKALIIIKMRRDEEK